MDPVLETRIAVQACQAGRFDEAEQQCRRVLAASPTYLQARLLLCDILAQTGRAAESEQLIDPALRENPAQADLLIRRGDALTALDRGDEAIQCYDNAIERRLVNPRAHASLSALLAKRADPRPRFTVSIITPTVCGAHLLQAVQSVQAQSYPFLEHIIVVDGPEHQDCVRAIVPPPTAHPIHFLALPFNVGRDDFCGHRVYGAAAFLVNGRFIAFLDEDNWLEPDHVSSLMSRITGEGLEWAYALRNIVNEAGQFVAADDCQSLGQWASWNDPNAHLVDVNCYLLRRDLAIELSPLWYRRYHDEENPDFVICRHLLGHHPRCGTNGRFTVNYRVRGGLDSWPTTFFSTGTT